MDYYYYDEDWDGEGYIYDQTALPEDESFGDVYQRCIRSSSHQAQQYITVLIGCSFLLRISWELLKRTLGNKYQCLYHVVSVVSGLISLWFYVGITNSIYVCLHILNLCLFLKLSILFKAKNSGVLLCFYTIICQLLFEYLLKSESYETIRGPQMVVGMKLISVAFEVQNKTESYQGITYIGYLLSPASLILGPWVPLKDYKPDLTVKFKWLPLVVNIFLNILFALVFLNLSNCILPWLKQTLGAGLLLGTYLDALSVRCSHYFVCFLSQATLVAASANALSFLPVNFSSTQSIVNPWAIEFPRSLSDVIRNWNIPMHLWLKQNIFDRLRSLKYSYFVSIIYTYLVSCLVHGFNFKVHLVLLSLSCFSYFENLLRHTLAQIFDACIESKACKTNCTYFNCPRNAGQLSTASLVLVRFVNILFSLTVVTQLAYLGVMLNAPTSTTSLETILQTWSNMSYMGHVLAIIMLVFYKCI